MKKKFSLLPILKIREYKEFAQLQEFVKVSSKYNKLSVELANLDKAIVDTIHAKHNNDFESMKNANNFISECKKRQKEIHYRRDELKVHVTKAWEAYFQKHKEAESMRVLQEKHNIAYRRHVNKKFLEELQEKSIWSKK